MILDTNYVGALVDRNPGALSLAREADGSPEALRLPTAVVWELFYGLGKLDDAEYSTLLRRKYSAILNGLVTVDVDDFIARGRERFGENTARLTAPVTWMVRIRSLPPTG